MTKPGPSPIRSCLQGLGLTPAVLAALEAGGGSGAAAAAPLGSLVMVRGYKLLGLHRWVWPCRWGL